MNVPIDDVIVFNNLNQDHISQILELNVVKLLDRIESVGFQIKLSKAAKDFLAEKGFDKNFGARPLNRAIQKYLEDPLAEEILKQEIQDGDIIKVDLDKKKDALKFTYPSKKPTAN